MIKILNAQQVREIDAYTIENEPISSIDLMERAASKCYAWIRQRLKSKKEVRIFCGMGNNGGDGLVIARMLGGTGHKVTVYKVMHTDKASEDFSKNEKRLIGARNVHKIDLHENDPFLEIKKDDLVIDAMLGSGLTRPLKGFLSEVVSKINASGAVVVAIDLPTGLFCEDNRENDPKKIIRADYTLTFQVPKLSFMLASNDKFIGEWHLLDIGLHPEAIKAAETRYFVIEGQDLRSFYRPRKKFSHKGDYGHALLLSGSYGKMGAAVLAARAALRSGAGLVSVQAPACGYDILQTSIPECMVIPDEQEHFISGLGDLSPFNAVGAGPGIGTEEQTARTLKLLIQNAGVPMVLDADALNIISENPTWRGFLPPGTILTPHPKEFARLAGKSSNDHDRLDKAIEFAHQFQVYVVLKGACTAIVSPDRRVFFNTTGNPGMATGGSGDVLTGMILAWLAQNYSPLQSALAGVYLHGLAGDMAASRRGFEGLTPGDMVEQIPKAIKKLFLTQ